MNILHDWVASIIWSENEINLSFFVHNVVLTSVLITKCVSSNNDGLSPAWHKSWNVGDDNGLSEDGSVKNVSNRSIWRLPHLFEIEL